MTKAAVFIITLLFRGKQKDTTVKAMTVVYKFQISALYGACGQTVKVIEKNDGINIYEAGEKVRIGIHPSDIMSYPRKEA